MAPTALVFDLDGTLVDSLEDLTWSLRVLHEQAGRLALPAEGVAELVGEGARKLLVRAWARTGRPAGDTELQALYERFLAIYDDHCTVDTHPYTGVLETLEALRGAGHPLALCTNKPIAPTRRVLAATGLDGFFGEAVFGGDSRPYKKPDPRILADALALLGAPAAVMVGDSPVDVAAARAAKWPVIAVGWGYAHGDPADLGADALIRRFRDLPGALARLRAPRGPER